MIAGLQTQGVNVGFNIGAEIDDKDTTGMIAGISQGGLGLPERDYYFRKGKSGRRYPRRLCQACRPDAGTSRRRPQRRRSRPANSIMAFETKLAKTSRTLVELRDPEKNSARPADRMAKLTPDLDWNGYFAKIDFPAGEGQMLVRQPEFLTAFDKLVT